jgi:hypothetical protein
MKQLFLEDIEKCTVNELKKIITSRRYKTKGQRLKADFKALIVKASYLRAQAAGLVELRACAL